MANHVEKSTPYTYELYREITDTGPDSETIHALVTAVEGGNSDDVKVTLDGETITLAAGAVDVTSVTLPTTIYSGVKAVAAAGTDEVLASSQALKSGVTIKAHSTNTGTIYVGPEGVAAATGFRLSAGESVFVEVDNLADVWLDCSVNGEGVSYIAS